MSNVYAFPQKTSEQPAMRGEAVCLACSHTWLAVAPTGTVAWGSGDDRLTLQCPACSARKGVYRHFVQYVDCKSWHCQKCSGFLFSIILAKGDVPVCACAACGELFNALDIFNK